MKKVIIVLFLLSSILNCSKGKNPLSSLDNLLSDSKIVFTSDRDSDGSEHIELGTKCEVYIMDMDGQNQTRLTDNDTYDFNPVFSPVGTKIIYTSRKDWLDGNLVIIDIESKNPITITEHTGGGENAKFSPDGSTILYRAGGVMVTMDLDTREITQMTEWKSDIRYSLGQDYPMAFSHDGSKILFLSRFEGSKNDIFTMEADGTNVQQLTDSPGSDTSCSFSKDDSKIVFTSYRTGKAQIYIMDSDGSNETQLTKTEEFNGYPDFSPDGSKIVFISYRDGRTEVYVMNSDGSSQKRLTNADFNKDRPHFSPDGRKIIFSTYGGAGAIYSMNTDGGDLTNLTEALGGNYRPQFQPAQ